MDYNADNGLGGGEVGWYLRIQLKSWPQLGPEIEGATGERYGHIVSINDAGDIVAIGSYTHNSCRG